MKRFNTHDNVEVVDIEQDTDEWLEWRNKGIGSSDVALLMSPDPIFDRTIRSLWEQRVGYERTVKLDNEHIKRGKELEPIIRDKVCDILNMNFTPVCIERLDAPYLRASLDGINYTDNCILEIKAPSEKYFNEYLNNWKIPENYYLQMQYQMLVSNTSYGYFAFYNKDLLNSDGEQEHAYPYIIPVKANYRLMLEIEKRCALFWKAVEDKVPIGWDEDELVLYEARPTIFTVFCNPEDVDKVHHTKLSLPYNLPTILKDTSVIVLADDFEEFALLKANNPDSKIRIISFIDTPFNNGNLGKFTQKKLKEAIRDARQ